MANKQMMLRLFLLSCFRDVQHKRPSHGESISVLDGVRGIAALMVVADHTGMAPVAFGINGVWLFFVLSGYLLTRPLITMESYGASWLGMYLVRRLLRILPMYIVYVLGVAAFFPVGDEWLHRHLTFDMSTGHLWTVQQELLFYLVLPFIVLLTSPLRKRPLAVAFFMVAVAYLSTHLLTEGYVKLTGAVDGNYKPFYLAPFMEGMASAYVMHVLKGLKNLSYRYVSVAGLPLMSLFLFLAWDAEAFSAIRNVGFSTTHPWEMGLLCAVFLLWVQLLPEGRCKRVIDAVFFRAIGVVGYSFYLLHWMVKDWFLFLLPVPVVYFFMTLSVTYVCACVTYSFIEKPCMQLFKHAKHVPQMA